MYGINLIKESICPKCGTKIYTEGVNVEVGYYYPPLHCEECGWTEKIDYCKVCKNKNSILCDECINSNDIKCASEWIGDYFQLK